MAVIDSGRGTDQTARGRKKMQLTLEARIARDKARFLAALRKVYMLAAACRATRIGRTTVHDWRQADPEFDAAVEATRVAAVDDLEATTFQLAMDGPWQQQTTLRIFLLKSLRRGTYGDKVAHTGGEPGDPAIRMEVVKRLRALPPAERAALEAALDKLEPGS